MFSHLINNSGEIYSLYQIINRTLLSLKGGLNYCYISLNVNHVKNCYLTAMLINKRENTPSFFVQRTSSEIKERI